MSAKHQPFHLDLHLLSPGLTTTNHNELEQIKIYVVLFHSNDLMGASDDTKPP